MTHMVDLDAEQLDGLYKLFVAECERDGSKPDFKSFHMWLVEGNYIDD